MIRKAFTSKVKAVNSAERIFETMISTEARDRQGDIVRATGAQLANFLKNPVVLFGHDYAQPPVAKALSVQILPGVGLKSTFQFPAPGINTRADEIRGLWEAGFLNAVSIGFIPLAARPLDGNDWGPQEYTSWELLEYSIVPVPANQEALRLAVKALQDRLKRQDDNPAPVEQALLKYLETLVDDLLDCVKPAAKNNRANDPYYLNYKPVQMSIEEWKFHLANVPSNQSRAKWEAHVLWTYRGAFNEFHDLEYYMVITGAI